MQMLNTRRRLGGLLAALAALAVLITPLTAASAAARPSSGQHRLTGPVSAASHKLASPHKMAGPAPTGPHLFRARPRGRVANVIPGNVSPHGGPVQNAPKVYVVFWDWTSDPNGEQAYLERFLSSVGNTVWLATVDQYGGGSTGDLLAGTWSDSTPIPANPSDAQIQAEAAAAINHFRTGDSVNVQIVVATPTGHSNPGFGPSGFCAEHGIVSADPNVSYTDLPYMTDAGSGCGENWVNSGASGLLDGVSIVEGHELAESITDPLLTGWYQSCGTMKCEIGDKCAWTTDPKLDQNITTPAGPFAVQPLWSNELGACIVRSVLAVGHNLNAGEELISPDGNNVLIMQTDGNLVEYDGTTGKAIWASGTVATGSNDHLAMQTDGNLVLYNSANTPLWQSGTYGASKPMLALQNDLNLVIYTPSGPAWAASSSLVNGNHGGPSELTAGQYKMSPNDQYKLIMQTDGNLVEYNSAGTPIWASGTAGTGSNNYVNMQSDGNLVVYNSVRALWASGTAGHTGSTFTFDVQNDGNLVIYWPNGVLWHK